MHDLARPEWKVTNGLTEWPSAFAAMEARAHGIAAGLESEQIWLLEHPPLYTAGTSADPSEMLDPRFPVHQAGRGGRYTYHGPGQRIGYIMINLAERGRDVRCYVHALEGWMIAALDRLGVNAWRSPGRIGIWTQANGNEAKIGAIGVRVRRWVTMHGFAINVAPNLDHFGGIIPCGIPDSYVTSLEQLGVSSDFSALDAALHMTLDAFLADISGTKKESA